MADLNQWAANIKDGTGCFVTKRTTCMANTFIETAKQFTTFTTKISGYPTRIVTNVSELQGNPVRIVINGTRTGGYFYGEYPDVVAAVTKNNLTNNPLSVNVPNASNYNIVEELPRLYPIMENVNDWLSSFSGADFIYQVNLNLSESLALSSIIIAKKYTKAEFLAIYGQYLKFSGSFDLYTNKTGVSAQTLLGSGGTAGGFDIVVPYLTDLGEGNDPQTSASYISIIKTLDIRNSYPSRSKEWATVVPSGLSFFMFSSNELDVGKDYALNSSTKGGLHSFFIGNNDQWTEAFNDVGLPWSFDLAKVKSGDFIPTPGDDPTPPGPVDPDNPVDPGGGGSENPSSDPVVYPTPTFIPGGCFSRYWLDNSQVQSFKDFLFSSGFWNDVARLVTNPIDYVIDLTYYPLVATGLINGIGNNSEIYCGNVDSKISAPILPDNNRSVIWGGSLNYKYGDKANGPYYGSYLDYEPYTTISLYIPYIGIRQMNVSMITDHVICLMYVIDFNSRTFTAILGLDGNKANMNPGQIVAQYTAPFGINYPLSGTEMQRQVLNMMTATTKTVQAIGGIITGFAGGGVAGAIGGGLSAVGAIPEIANSAQTSPTITGTMSPVSGLYAPQKPYLLINTPSRARPADYDKYAGLTSSYTGKVSKFATESGVSYLRCKEVYLSTSRWITNEEANEIISLLKGGIYVN